MSIKQDLLEGIEFIVKNYIENAPFDKTRVGIIQGVSSNNTYTVKIDNRIFNNVPYLGNGTLGLNTTVRVVVPENQMNNIVILGTTQKEDTPIVVAVSSVNGKTGDVVLNIGDIPNLNKTLEQKYSALNPPPYPVKSINGLTGEVVLFIPSKTSQLINDSDYQNGTQMNTAISMEASNRKSADDSLQAQIDNGNSDILNLQDTKANKTEVPTKVSQLLNDSGFLTSIPSEYVTDTEMQAYAQPKGDYATNIALNTEITNRQSADNTLQQNIDNINNKVNNLQSVQILNKGVINSTIANVQNICSNYIVAEYSRQPKNLDGLIITLTDSVPPNDKVQYVYSGFSNVWVDTGSAQIEITEGSKTEKGVLQVGDGINVASGVISTNKETIGLANVDNTSDLNKPLSTATRNALNLKANSADLSIVATSGSYNDLLNKPMALPASDVSSWAKEPNKPIYTSNEVGLGNVPNVTTNNQKPTWTIVSTLANLVSGETLATAFGKIAKAIQSLISHIANVSNPHSVTKTQVGLGNVDNTADINKPINTATQNALNLKADTADLSDVAFSGLYSDLTGAPTIPTKTSQLTNDSNFAQTNEANIFTQPQTVGGTKISQGSATVIGVTKNTTVFNGNQAIFSRGAVFSGTAADAGLVTRGVCGVTTPDISGNCEKAELYLNYDGNNNYARKVYLGGTSDGSMAVRKDMLPTSLPANGGNADTVGNKTPSDLQNYNNLTNKPTIPVNSDFTLSGLGDTTIATPSNSQILQYNGTKWVNANPQSFSQQQANWNETSTSSVQYIQNKPTSLPADGGNADTVGGFSVGAATNNSVNSIVRTDNSGYLNCSWLKSTSGVLTGKPHGVWVENGNWLYYQTTDDFINNCGIATKEYTDTKAPLASPTLTGTPKAPTATAGTNTTQIATTEFVQRKVEEETINIQVSTIQPINQKAGDIWYRVL